MSATVNGNVDEHFEQFMETARAYITNRFENPDHPAVQQHAARLNLIKERLLMIEIKPYKKRATDWSTLSIEEVCDFDPDLWSLEKLEQYEAGNNLHLPPECKAYLLEISGGDNILLPHDPEKVAILKKPFPITPGTIHPIGHHWGINAWVYPDDNDWVNRGVFESAGDMQSLFTLPAGARHTDGCLFIGYSWTQDPLYLIMNGAFEGEVWVDTLQYGAEAGGCFAAASKSQLTLLHFIAESLRANAWGYPKDEADHGAWLNAGK